MVSFAAYNARGIHAAKRAVRCNLYGILFSALNPYLYDTHAATHTHI